MAKNKIGLEFSGFEELIERLDASGGDVKEAVEKFKEKIMAETLALSLEENIDNADGESSIDANNEA